MTDYYLLNIDNIIKESDISTMSAALNNLRQRQEYLTPLFNECIEKRIDWHKLDEATATEWNDLVFAIEKLTLKLYK